MFITKKSRQSAMLEIANSEVIDSLVRSFVGESKTEENGWLNAATYHKKDKGAREIIVAENFVMIRPRMIGFPDQEGFGYNLEKSGFSRISAHRNQKGRVIVSKKNMIKLFAEEFAAQLILAEFGLPYRVSLFTRKEREKCGTDVAVIKYKIKARKK